MSDRLLVAKELKKIYNNGLKEVRALDGIDLDLDRERSVAIVGPSGAGKSTLLHMLGGLDNPTSGEVLLDGADIYAVSDSERSRIRNRRIGFVFQSYHLLPEFSVLENVMMPALISRSPAPSEVEGSLVTRLPRAKSRGDSLIKDKAMGILKAVGLGERATHRPGELSGGESQRVAIARALVNEPELLLCDEPTGNLDSRTSGSIYELLFELRSRKGMSLIIATHDENASQRAEEIIRIKDGKLA